MPKNKNTREASGEREESRDPKAKAREELDARVGANKVPLRDDTEGHVEGPIGTWNTSGTEVAKPESLIRDRYDEIVQNGNRDEGAVDMESHFASRGMKLVPMSDEEKEEFHKNNPQSPSKPMNSFATIRAKNAEGDEVMKGDSLVRDERREDDRRQTRGSSKKR